MIKHKTRSKGFSVTIKYNKDNPLRAYIDSHIKKLQDNATKLEDGGLRMHKSEVEDLSRYLFASSYGSYVGIESNLPSTYYEVYPKFLKDNEDYLKRVSSEDRKNTKRILIAPSGGEIRADAVMHPQLYKDFIEWHQKNKVALYWIDEYKAEKIKAQFNVDSTDISYWSACFAASFSPLADKQNIALRVVRKTSRDFKNIKSYVEEVVSEAELLTLDTDKLPILSTDVVEQWEGYIGNIEFRQTGLGKLLTDELPASGRILDTAAGSGYETLILSSRGYDVTSNEYDPVWNRILKNKIAETNLPVEVYQYDWRDLSNHLKPLYSGVISVGNSLCMVIGKNERQKSINEFYKLLKPGGKLIVDERNFDVILGRLNKGIKCYSKGPLYACTKMNAELLIEDQNQNLIRFNFFENKSGKSLGSTIVQALPKNELLGMLEKAGFKLIKQFSDFRPTKNDHADIFTYIATK